MSLERVWRRVFGSGEIRSIGFTPTGEITDVDRGTVGEAVAGKRYVPKAKRRQYTTMKRTNIATGAKASPGGQPRRHTQIKRVQL